MKNTKVIHTPVYVSVALCSYNGAKFIKEQLASILEQTRLPDEIVVCDDVSTDGTFEILQCFAAESLIQVRLVRNAERLGSTQNYEQAIQMSSGDIIVLSDQDDVWLPNRVECLLRAFQENPDAGYVFSDAELVDEHLAPLNASLWETLGFSGMLYDMFTSGEQLRCLIRRQVVTGATMAFRGELKPFFLPIPTEYYWIHDGWISIVLSALGARGVVVPEPLILYRQHLMQQVGAARPPRRTLKDRLSNHRQSRVKHAAEFGGRAAAYTFLSEHLKRLHVQNGNKVVGAIALLVAAGSHYKVRSQIQMGNIMSRVPAVVKEWQTGRYGEFSNSIASVLFDVLP